MIEGQHAPDHTYQQITAYVDSIDTALIWLAQHLNRFTPGQVAGAWRPWHHPLFGSCLMVQLTGEPAHSPEDAAAPEGMPR